MFAAMIQHMHFRGIEEQAGFLVVRKHVVLPGFPQAFHHLDKFGSAVVASVMVEPIDAGEVEDRA